MTIGRAYSDAGRYLHVRSGPANLLRPTPSDRLGN